ncbi:peptidoglycan-recognition protein SC2-like [Tubulanus polymorphus]|uniref:peptidoglycan-recognition protein SC2-like n=1 Tax=Tubulanus polymorphus TaxID=672921 RepID=UPI003DA5CB00
MAKTLMIVLILLSILQFSMQYNCPGVNVITRAQWGARRARRYSTLATPVPYVFIHHSAGPQCQQTDSCKRIVRAIQAYHMDVRKWDDIGYNFLVGGDGNAYEGRGWGRVGAQCKGFNSRSLGICFVGNFMNSLPTASAQRAASNLMMCFSRYAKVTTNYSLYGHRDAGQTLCPGNALYNRIRTWPHYNRNPPRTDRKQLYFKNETPKDKL